MAVTYTVSNPRGIPIGVHVIRYRQVVKDPTDTPEEQIWYAGDDFEKPITMNQAEVDNWEAAGFLTPKE